jgi:hypothetical protein
MAFYLPDGKRFVSGVHQAQNPHAALWRVVTTH